MHWFSRLARKTAPAVLALLPILSRGARAEPPLTLEQALAEAAARNARLPVSEMDVAASQQQLVAARGARLPRLSVESTLQVAPPDLSYGTGGASSFAGEERLQIVGRQTLYDGGALRGSAALIPRDHPPAESGGRRPAGGPSQDGDPARRRAGGCGGSAPEASHGAVATQRSPRPRSGGSAGCRFIAGSATAAAPADGTVAAGTRPRAGQG
ncbi:MAG: hypothetical protein E6J64_20110, partial [Deltaproteobacteria bacterium]